MKHISTKAITVDKVHLESSRRDELTIADLLEILRRRSRQILLTAAVCFLLGLIVCVLVTPKFEGKAVIEIEKTNTDLLGLDNIVAGSTEGPGDALNANLDLQTETEILKSDALALKVIEDLGLDKTRDFQPRWNPLGWLTRFSPSYNVGDVPGATLENSPQRRTSAVKVFRANLKVEPTAGTRLIEIRYFHSDREVAPAVVNDMVRALKDYGFQTRYAATRDSSEWLNGQLAELKRQTQSLQTKVVELQKDSGVYTLGTDSQGRDQVYSSTLDRLQQATTAFMSATSNRIMKDALYQTAKSGDPELISALAGGSLMGASPGVQSSFTLLQTLRSQQATLQAQLAQDSGKFGSDYPKLADERSSLQSVTKAISDEVDRIGKRAQNDYIASKDAEDRLKRVYAERKAEADRLNDKTIEYGIAKQEADDSRALYEDLFKRLKEAGIIERFHSSNISVVQPGTVPAKPAKPNLPLYLGASLLGGLILGVAGALFTDSIDSKIQSIAGMEELLQAPLLAVLPAFRRPVRTWRFKGSPRESSRILDEPSNPFLEALRGLRTKLVHSRNESPSRVILVTSSVSGEGKSTVSANFAALLARSGKRVLLVEADMRNPCSRTIRVSDLIDENQLDKLLGGSLRDQAGREARNFVNAGTRDSSETHEHLKDFSTELSVLLNDTEGQLQGIPLKSAYGMEVVQSGPTPLFPAELLDSDRMHELLDSWKAEFDYVVLDSPPLLPVTDATVISHMADVILVVARPGYTSSKGLKRALELVEVNENALVGVVVNAVDRKSASYSEYYGSGTPIVAIQRKERAHV
jgi:polysaccharide biosynthesis transport protein